MILIVKAFPIAGTFNTQKYIKSNEFKRWHKKDEVNLKTDYSRINLKDSADEIIKKIKKAKSDSDSIPDDLKSLNDKPEAFNLLNIYSEISKNSLEKVLKEMSGKIIPLLKRN